MKQHLAAGDNPPRPVLCGISADDGNASDYLNQDGAMALAKKLERYWHEKGYTAARFWAEPIGMRFSKIGTYELYRVACNLVNGLPPRYRD